MYQLHVPACQVLHQLEELSRVNRWVNVLARKTGDQNNWDSVEGQLLRWPSLRQFLLFHLLLHFHIGLCCSEAWVSVPLALSNAHSDDSGTVSCSLFPSPTKKWLAGDLFLVTLVIHRWVQNKIRAPYNLIKYKTILLDDNLWFCALAWRRLPLAAFLDIRRIFQCRVMILWQGKLNHTLGGGLYTAQVGMALFLRVGVSFEIH